MPEHRQDYPEPPPTSPLLGGCAIVSFVLFLLFGHSIAMVCWAFYELIVEPAIYLKSNQYPTYTYHFRLTIDVDVDGDTHTGSGVYEVSAKPGPKGTNWGAPRSKGEAIFIDLGKYGPLVMTMRGRGLSPGYDCPANMISGAYWRAPGIKLTGEENYKILASSDHPPHPIGARGLCETVTFDDVNDPKTIRAVDPGNLEASFDGHVHFISATVEVNSEPITHGIDKHLTWLPEVKKHVGGQLDENTFLAYRTQLQAQLHGHQTITARITKESFQYRDFMGDN